jgi:hypothetical protein
MGRKENLLMYEQGMTEEQGKPSQAGGYDKAVLAAFAQYLSAKRLEWVQARESSGIEQEWIEMEMAYDGADESAVGQDEWRRKPPGRTPHRQVQQTSRSRVIPNLTAPYCDAATARLMPAGARIFAIEPTPIPDMDPGLTVQAQQAGQDPAMLLALVQEVARQKADRAEKQIEDWTLGRLEHAVKGAVRDAVKVGTGIVKGPYPESRKRRQVSSEDGAIGATYFQEIIPASRHVSYWNVYPDPSVDDDIQMGEGVFEKDIITRKALIEMAKLPGAFPDEIEAVLKEGPCKIDDLDRRNLLPVGERLRKSWQVWYFHGQADKDMLEALGCECGELEAVDISVCMANHRVISISHNVLDSGEYPYDLFRWKRRSGSPWGSGVAKDVNVAQLIFRAAARAMMDNSGLSSGPMWVFLDGILEPLDGRYELGARKGWRVARDAGIDDVRKAINFIPVPSVQAELAGILQFAMKLAEDSSNLPQILQGQMGARAPDTVGGMAILNKNASDFLMEKANDLDDSIISRQVKRYYDWIMQYGPEDARGDSQVVAKASVMAERAIYVNDLLQMNQLVLNPASGIDVKKYIEEILVSKRIDPDRLKSDQDPNAPSAGQPPIDPGVVVLQAKMALEQQKLQLDEQALRSKTELDAARLQLDREKAEMAARLEDLRLQIHVAKNADEQQMAIKKILADMQKFREAEAGKNRELSIKETLGSGI